MAVLASCRLSRILHAYMSCFRVVVPRSYLLLLNVFILMYHKLNVFILMYHKLNVFIYLQGFFGV